jgi:hypothetical protein
MSRSRPSESSSRYPPRIFSHLLSSLIGCSFAWTVASFWNQKYALYTTMDGSAMSYHGLNDYNGFTRGTEIATLPVIASTGTVSLRPSANQPTVSPLYDPQWLVASKTKEVAVTIIPKVMCSSIRSVINGMECNDRESRCAECRKDSSIGLLPLSNYTRVVFFRDPLERALSTYKNSEKNRHIEVQGCQKWKSCSFEYWVDRLVDVRSMKNEHFLPQTVISQRDKMHYHYHFRMSNKNHTDFFFRELLGKEPISSNKSSNSVSSTTNSTTTTTSSFLVEQLEFQRQLVAKKFEEVSNQALIRLLLLYQDDFELWESMLALSPRGPGEYTMYDHYKEHLEETLRPQVAKARGSFHRTW